MKYGTKKIKTETTLPDGTTGIVHGEVEVIEEATFAELLGVFGEEKMRALALSQDTTNRMNEARVDLREGGKKAAEKARRAAREMEITAALDSGEMTPLQAAEAFRNLYTAK